MDRTQVSNKEFASTLNLILGTGHRRDAKFQAIAELLSSTFEKAGVGIYQYLSNSTATLAEAAFIEAHREQASDLVKTLQVRRSEGYLKLEIVTGDNIRLVGMNVFTHVGKPPTGCLIVIFPLHHHIPWETQKMLVVAKEFIQEQLSGDWSN